jgi:hypothetical protein
MRLSREPERGWRDLNLEESTLERRTGLNESPEILRVFQLVSREEQFKTVPTVWVFRICRGQDSVILDVGGHIPIAAIMRHVNPHVEIPLSHPGRTTSADTSPLPVGTELRHEKPRHSECIRRLAGLLHRRAGQAFHAKRRTGGTSGIRRRLRDGTFTGHVRKGKDHHQDRQA